MRKTFAFIQNDLECVNRPPPVATKDSNASPLAIGAYNKLIPHGLGSFCIISANLIPSPFTKTVSSIRYRLSMCQMHHCYKLRHTRELRVTHTTITCKLLTLWTNRPFRLIDVRVAPKTFTRRSASTKETALCATSDLDRNHKCCSLR